MYKPGDAKLNLPCPKPDEFGSCDCGTYEHEYVSDARSGDAGCGMVAYLPHSCDSWVIGGKEQITQMIFDLSAIYVKMDELEKKNG